MYKKIVMILIYNEKFLCYLQILCNIRQIMTRKNMTYNDISKKSINMKTKKYG